MAQLATMAAQQQMLNNRLAALGKGQLGGKGKDKKGKGKGTGKPYWECAVCGCTTNFATNTACYQCWMPKGTPPPPQHPSPPVSSPSAAACSATCDSSSSSRTSSASTCVALPGGGAEPCHLIDPSRIVPNEQLRPGTVERTVAAERELLF